LPSLCAAANRGGMCISSTHPYGDVLRKINSRFLDGFRFTGEGVGEAGKPLSAQNG